MGICSRKLVEKTEFSEYQTRSLINFTKYFFQSPRKVADWPGVLDGSRQGSACVEIQPILGNSTITGDEDCLFLNVFSKSVSL